MALTIRTYPGDPVRTAYPVDFDLGYLKKEHIYVYTGTDWSSQLGYTWTSETEITLDAPQTTEFYIRRITPRDALVNNYYDGAGLKEENLDASFLQTLMVMEEQSDGFISRPIPGVTTSFVIRENLDMQGNFIVNLLDGINDKDAANMGQIGDAVQASLDAQGYAASAAQDADDALAAKNAAVSAKDAAQTSEAHAAASESNAQKWAEEAEDVEVEPGKYSALHWAAKAQNLTSNIVHLDETATQTMQGKLQAPYFKALSGYTEVQAANTGAEARVILREGSGTTRGELGWNGSNAVYLKYRDASATLKNQLYVGDGYLTTTGTFRSGKLVTARARDATEQEALVLEDENGVAQGKMRVDRGTAEVRMTNNNGATDRAVLALLPNGNIEARTYDSATAGNAAVMPKSEILGQVSLASAGYEKLPNGKILQWGSVTNSTGGGSNDVLFPTAFPNNCFGVTVSAVKKDAASSVFFVYIPSNGLPTKTGFSVKFWNADNSSHGATTDEATWMAIGD